VVFQQPVVAEDDVRVAVHVELDEGRLFVEAAQDQPGLDRAAGRAGRAVRLPDGRRVAAGAGAPAGARELGRLPGAVALQEAVRRPRVEQTFDQPPAGRHGEPASAAVFPGHVGASRAGGGPWLAETGSEGVELELQSRRGRRKRQLRRGWLRRGGGGRPGFGQGRACGHGRDGGGKEEEELVNAGGAGTGTSTGGRRRWGEWCGGRRPIRRSGNAGSGGGGCGAGRGEGGTGRGRGKRVWGDLLGCNV
jgi:hypothetical protein